MDFQILLNISQFIKCVNDVTYSFSYVTRCKIGRYTFVNKYSNLKFKQMKNSISIMTITAFMAGILLTSCQLSPKKVDNAEDKVVNTMDKAAEINQALNDSIQQFKMESEQKIDEYQETIAELKTKIKTVKKENKALYEQKLVELEQKNNDLKKKLNDYKDNGQDKWTSFKSEFSHDMDELGKAFKDLTVNNVN